MDPNWTTSPRQKSVENNCGRPMLHLGDKGLSLEWKGLEIHNGTATRNQDHVSLIWQSFSSTEAQKFVHATLTRERASCYRLPIFFSAGRALHHPYPRHFVLSQFRFNQETIMAARRAQRSTSTISRKNWGLWTIYCFIGRVAFTVAFPVAFPGFN